MRGVILIHGLTGTPATMAPLAEAFGKAGYKVITPILAGHGETPKKLSAIKWNEWYDDVCKAYDALTTDAGEIYCAGISLGSLLALKLALDKRRPLKKIAALSTPLKLSPLLEKMILPLTHIPPLRFFLKYSKKDWKEGVLDEIGREIYKNASYPKMPVKSVWELQKLQKDLLKNLPQLKTPVLLIHSIKDKVALPLNVALFRKISKLAPPKVLWLENSHHVVTLDTEKELVAEYILNFFK
ncbi:MAG: alpha/beta fold hydrolase [Deltaproteobacteria bacterium]|nr:alpha/beta fold hydrolase [Deltaproteobacteria bacterium]